MGISQAFLHPKLSLEFSSAGYFDKRSEAILPITSSMLSSCAVIRGGNRSTASNRFRCQRSSADELPLMSSKHEAPTLLSVDTSNVKKVGCPALAASCKGLGIIDFMRKKNFLITGATGFLAKVLIEKILRMQQDFGKLFLIIRADDSTSALKRLKNEVMNTGLFKELRELHGMEFEKFILERLVPVVGDMTQHNLGIDTDMANILRKEVDIIISSAATTTFDERYDVALETNTRSVYRLLEFGKCCEKVQLLMHISTAYVNGKREGQALEEPFQMGYSIAKEISESTPLLNIQDEFRLTNEALKDLEIELTNSENGKLINGPDSQMKIDRTMKDLGMKRAGAYGWQDTYVFTKAMAEMIIVHGREDLPVAIVRPSIIESTYSQPFPGWIEGNRMADPIITLYGRGRLSCFLGDPDNLLNVIPVDMVVNATLAAMPKHAGKPGVGVYQVASSVANPIRLKEFFDIAFEHFKCNPFTDKKGKPLRSPNRLIWLDTMEDFYRQALDNKAGLSTSAKYMLEQLKYMAKIYEPYTFYKGRFDISNSEKLFEELSEEELREFRI